MFIQIGRFIRKAPHARGRQGSTTHRTRYTQRYFPQVGARDYLEHAEAQHYSSARHRESSTGCRFRHRSPRPSTPSSVINNTFLHSELHWHSTYSELRTFDPCIAAGADTRALHTVGSCQFDSPRTNARTLMNSAVRGPLHPKLDARKLTPPHLSQPRLAELGIG